MLIQVLYIKVILTWYVHKRNSMILVVGSSWFASDLLWICLWIGLIPKLQEIDSIYSLVKGISGDFDPILFFCWEALFKMYMSDHMITNNNWQSAFTYFTAEIIWVGNCFLYGDLGIQCGPRNNYRDCSLLQFIIY